MTTRRNFLTMVGAGSALALAGCARETTGTPIPAAGPPDVLIVDTTGGLAVVRHDGRQSLGHAVPSPDGSTIFVAKPAGADTDLLAVSTGTGRTDATVRLRGAWVPRVVSSGGRSVALTPPEPATPAATPAGRDTTTILVSGVSGDEMRLDLPGNYVPDAFASDNTGMFVLDWLPAGAPDRYRVREIDFTTKAPTPLLTRDKQPIPPGAEEKMRGQRRTAVWGSGNGVLYTLYTNQPGTASTPDPEGWPGEDNAFIHTLQLEQHWAYCVDLPAPFGSHPNAAHALATDPDGSHLYVVDAVGGRLATVDTGTLAVSRVVDTAPMTGDAYAEATGRALYLGAGAQVRVIDRMQLATTATWHLGGTVTGLVRSPDGSRIYVGQPGAVEWWDTATGTRRGSVPVPALTGLRAAV